MGERRRALSPLRTPGGCAVSNGRKRPRDGLERLQPSTPHNSDSANGAVGCPAAKLDRWLPSRPVTVRSASSCVIPVVKTISYLAPSLFSTLQAWVPCNRTMKFSRKMICSFSDWRIPVLTTSTLSQCCRRCATGSGKGGSLQQSEDAC